MPDASGSGRHEWRGYASPGTRLSTRDRQHGRPLDLLIASHHLYTIRNIPYDAQDGSITYNRLRQVNQLRRLVDGNGVVTATS
jgi:hypothetical protein